MKWLLLALCAVILFWLLRRLGQQQSTIVLSANAPLKTAASGTIDPTFAGRIPMSFDEFYNRYYAGANIDRDFVSQVLQFVSKAGGVPAELLRPEDRLDSLPRHTVSLQFAKKMLETAMQRQAAAQGIQVPEFQLETLDDVILQLEPHQLEAFKTHGFGGS
ncbi:MAG: hypothetical protein ROO76_23380 [Terriglobia bacterium]|jgi:hypothetical protein|nr:hypothetical protein [Terriglobia bacterium]